LDKLNICAFTGHRPHRFPFGYNETDPRCLVLKANIENGIKELSGYSHRTSSNTYAGGGNPRLHSVNSEKFKAWHRLECARAMLNKDERKKIEREVTRELLHEKNLLIEAKDVNGKWVREEDSEI